MTKKAKHKTQRGPDMAEKTNESASITAAREAERQAAEAAREAGSLAGAAQQAVEEASRALTEKEQQVGEVRTEFEAVGERLAVMPLDDPDSERIGGRHRHLEMVLRRLEGEYGGCHETLLTAQRRAEDAIKNAEVADAVSRNAGRRVTLIRLTEAFPSALGKLLDLIRGHNQVLSEADQESESHDLPRLGRARLLPRQDQLRRHEMYELSTIIVRHEAGLSITPSAAWADFAMDSGGNGGEDPPEAEWSALTASALEAEAVDSEDVPTSELDWAVLTAQAVEGDFDE